MATTVYKSVDKLRRESKFKQSTEVLFHTPTLRWETYQIFGFNSRPRKRIAYADSKIYFEPTHDDISNVNHATAAISLNIESRAGTVLVDSERFLLAADARRNSWGLYPALRRDGTWVFDPHEDEVATFELSRSIDWKIFIQMDDTWLVLIHLGATNFRLYKMENPPMATKVAECLGGTQISGQLTLLAIMEGSTLSISSAFQNVLDDESPSVFASVACVARNIILCDKLFR